MTAVDGPTDPTLSHLQAELVRFELRVRREIWRWQQAGQDPRDAFRGLYLSAEHVEQLLARPFATSWGQIVVLEPSEEEAFARAEAQALERARAAAEAARQQAASRLEALAGAFDLDRFDLDAFLVCLAPALDLRYERFYAFLQDDVTRKRPTLNLVLDLLAGDAEPEGRLRLQLRFAGDAPLFRHRLLEWVAEAGGGQAPPLGRALAVDPSVVSWLLGRYVPHAELGGRAVLSSRPEDEADVLLAGPVVRRLSPGDAIVVFTGADHAAQQAAARLLAARAARPLLTVDLGALVDGGASPTRALQVALRDARLTGALLCLNGWDACCPTRAEAGQGREGAAREVPPELLAALCAHPGPLVVAGRGAWQAEGIDRRRTFLWLEFPMPDHVQRRALWCHYLDDAPHCSAAAGAGAGRPLADIPGVDNHHLDALAGQFSLTTGQIRDAVASARDLAVRAGEPLHATHLLAAARAHSNPRLSSLASKIVPRYNWEDIVLPPDQLSLLHEIVATIRGRPLVLETWGVGRKLASSAGVTMLFSGEPGTGKTMAAEVMANELGLDLYKIDLSTIVSKYIGETEKNLEQIFAEAQSSNAILFFDEADAIFGKRSEVKDAHDRYANIEVSYLLQRMEAYQGVTILATNLRANLDEAFTRRLQFAVDFPFPDEGDRRRIWQTLFPPGVPREEELDFTLLARRFKLAGGNIRNVLVSAAYLAASDGGRVGMRHLLHGTRRELQKMGRLVNERDLLLGDDNA